MVNALELDSVLAILDMLRCGIAVVDRGASCLLLNRCARALCARRDGIWLNGNRLCAVSAAENAVLHRMLKGCVADSAISNMPTSQSTAAGFTRGSVRAACGGLRENRRVGGMRISRPAGRPALLVVTATLGSEIDAAATPNLARVALVMIADPEVDCDLDPALLQDLFGLTPAEARLAAKIAEGKDVRHAAKEIGVHVTTARSHLSHVLFKTGTTRQVELVRLLMAALGPM